MGKETWVFEDYCSQKSKLGLLLFSEVKKIEKEKQITDEEELKRTALINLGETIGCEIKPNDFLALGPEEYLNIRKDVREGIKQKIDSVMVNARRIKKN
jgi:hypothetical protein